MSNKILWCDLETTGTNVGTHGIVEIACILEVHGKEVSNFHAYMAPPTEMILHADPIALETNRLTIDEITEFPGEKEVHAAFLDWLGRYVERYDRQDKCHFAGFNCEFDFQFMQAWFSRCEDKYFGSWFWYDLIDARAFSSYFLRHDRQNMEDGKLMSVAENILTRQELRDALGGGIAHGADVDSVLPRKCFTK